MTDAPRDATATEAWGRLQELADRLQPDLRAWFADDPQRVDRLTFDAGDLHVDLSKALVHGDVLDALLDLAAEVGLKERREAMFAGEHVNPTEDRAVLHTALRRPTGDRLEVDGTDVVPEVHDVLRRVYEFAEKVRDGRWTGATGERIRTVVNIGIGGSDLGPVMAYEALAPYRQDGLECRFISNIDPTDAATTLAGLDPASTLFIVSSKTFGTLETLTNARLCRAWLLDGLSRRRRRGSSRQALRRRLDGARQGRRLRHRPRQRLRVLGLGRRPLLRRLRDRHLTRGRHRARAVRRVPARLPHDGRALPHHRACGATCRRSWGCSTSGTPTSSVRRPTRCSPTPSSCTASRRTSSSSRWSPTARGCAGTAAPSPPTPARCSGASQGPTASTPSTS